MFPLILRLFMSSLVERNWSMLVVRCDITNELQKMLTTFTGVLRVRITAQRCSMPNTCTNSRLHTPPTGKRRSRGHLTYGLCETGRRAGSR